MRLSLPLIFLSLLAASSLWVAEEAINGQGLHLVLLWFGLLVLSGLRIWQGDFAVLLRWTLPDVAVALIFVGHVISTAFVFIAEGDRRAAVNLTLEWGGISAAWVLLRVLIQERKTGTALTETVIAIAVGLACFGIWQHHFFYAQASSEYLAARQELDAAMKSGTPAAISTITRLVGEFQRQGIPLEGAARQLWENRLLHSTEPLGTFALTNTLAGILAAAFVLQTGLISRILGTSRSVVDSSNAVKSSKAPPASRQRWLLFVACFQAIVLLYCLILTKSRSAWCGALCGIAMVLILRSRAALVRATLRWMMMGGLVAGLLVVVVGLFGGIDRQVILESPRSLQFRLLYWTGTLQMLAEHPVVGAGPGNFRQMYLPHKAIESSEEIRDPHNIFLDAWSSAGILGLAGIVLITFSIAKYVRSDEQGSGIQESSTRVGKQAAWALLLGFLLHIAWEWISGTTGAFEWSRLLLLSGGFLALIRGQGALAGDRSCYLAAATALLIHLLAAGGFEMPIVMLVLLSMIGRSICPEREPEPEPDAKTDRKSERKSERKKKLDADEFPPQVRGGLVVAGVGIVGLVAGCLLGLQPVTQVDRLMLNAQSDAERYPNSDQVFKSFQESVEADAWAVLPRQRFAEYLSYKLRELQSLSEQSSDADLQEKIRTRAKRVWEITLSVCEDLISADRRGLIGYQIRSECLTAVSTILGDKSFLEKAIEDQTIVTQRNPTASDVWLKLAELHRDTGNSVAAKEAALRSLEIDQINHAWGHQDQYLSESDVKALEALTKTE
ncbi:MAG: O-antigen ligase family protein [Planctomycetaceae bacterium]|nr:O-antigen ligase family protein [Planctomycetaceae bacterium]